MSERTFQSVIVPIFRRERALRERVHYLLSLSFLRFEMLINYRTSTHDVT